ncbi:sulfatase [Luteolibacter algae]|uniref:Sulfatase n=1 Tax=Luteolibacter algae TaxID=454151 RepID=A0ABW5DAP1_9BACT
MRPFKKQLVIFAAFALTGFSTLWAEKKPNLLVIITDEHNFRTLGCYRDQLPPEQAFLWGANAAVETPNIDSIARNGVLFNRMYGSAPVCSASRSSMFTGLYPNTVGIPNNSNKPGDGKYLHADVTTIADVLRDAGYITGYAGKWHLAEAAEPDEVWSPAPVDDPSDDYGFTDKKFMFNGGHDKFKGIDADGNPYRAAKRPTRIGEDKYGQPLYEDKRSKNVKFTTDWLADRAVEFIDGNKDKPFFLVVSIPDPHTPNSVREPYDTMFDDVEITLPKTFHDAHNAEDKAKPEWQKPSKTKDQAKLIEEIRQYFGMVKCIDDNVGRIIQKLKEDNLMEDTIIVFTSDHGDLLGEHARVNKGTIHEASDKIPFVISKGMSGKSSLIPAGKVINQAANTTDWMPTFLSLLEIDCPEVQGRDLSPLITGPKPADWDDVTFVRLGFYAAVTEQYKLHVVQKDKPWLLDIKADPDEIKNFIDDPAYRDVVKKLAQDLIDYMEKNNDPNKGVRAQLETLLNS